MTKPSKPLATLPIPQAAPARPRTAPVTALVRPRIVRIGDPGLTDPSILGAKGARLHEMAVSGLPVPSAFCLTTHLWRDVGGADADDLPETAVEAALAAYRALGDGVVAVRSSATTEDGAEASAAGMHDTVLGVRGRDEFLAAVLRCRRSLASARAVDYHAGAAGEMAVVVQEMVPADAAGVLFTVDPMNPAGDDCVIEAAWGLGEGIVSGQVVTDRFVVDPGSGRVRETEVREKVQRAELIGPSRVGLRTVPAGDRSRPALTDEQCRTLAGLAGRIKAEQGADQDIEFAVHRGEVLLLQTRPVTAVATAPRAPEDLYVCDVPDTVRDGTLWSRMDIGEIFTGTMTPLGLSFARYYQRTVHRDCVGATGMRDTGRSDLHMGYLDGQVYLNISYTAHLLQQEPPLSDQTRFTDRFISPQIDRSRYHNPFGDFPSGAAQWRGRIHWVAATAREMATMGRRATAMTEARHAEFDRARAIDLGALDRHQLHRELRRALDFFHDMHVGYMPYYMNAFGFYGALDELSRTWLGDAAPAYRDALKSDMSALRTLATGRDLAGLAENAAGTPVEQILLDHPLEETMERLAASPHGREFLAGPWAAFMREHGVRGQQEMEISGPRWIDDPTYVLQILRRHLGSLDERAAAAGRTQTRDLTPPDVRLAPHRRAVLAGVSTLYTRCSEYREIGRMAMITSIWLVRRILVEVAERAVRDGHLASVDQLRYLDFDRLCAFLGGSADRSAAFDPAALRVARREHAARLSRPLPPLSVLGRFDRAAAAGPLPADATTLTGLGTSSGQVSGRARVITNLAAQAGELQPGEILVASFTDASWTPLFAVAGGVVTDVGSVLSHSSIVAREFRIPSVVNTAAATQVVRTGDVLHLDGDTGRVHREPGPGSPAAGGRP